MDYSKMTKNELITLIELREKPVECKNPQCAYDYLKPYGKEQQEHFIVLMLDGAMKIKNVKVVSIGLVNKTLVHPREVFAPALENRATAIMIAHNHPSGSLDPSIQDIDLTDNLIKASKYLGIQIVDHIIFSDNDYFSMAENGTVRF